MTRPVDRENRQKSSRKAIRTPSGKNMSASEYLRGGYRPSEKSLSEEGMHIFLDYLGTGYIKWVQSQIYFVV